MTPDTALALSSELRFLLKDGWSITRDPSRFTVRPTGALSAQELRDEVWRVAQFVAYPHFASIAEAANGSISIVSKNAAGNGFEIVFENGVG